MANRGSSGSGEGMGLASVIGVVFVVLKLCVVISWSWWWVLSPWWISFLFVVALFAVLGIILIIASAVDE